MIPADLFDQLREKDPELWERMRRMPIYVHRDSSLTVDLTKSDNTELVASWLQHCLQEAIRARGWAYTLTYNPPSGPSVPYYDVCVWPTSTSIHVKADTEAEALLRAYLAAIQVVT